MYLNAPFVGADGLCAVVPLGIFNSVVVSEKLVPFAVIFVLVMRPMVRAFLSPINEYWFIYVQSYRVLREVIFLMLYRYQVIPDSLTFYGKNFDLLIGASAPFVAYYYSRQKKYAKEVAIVWNLAGMVLQLNLFLMLLSADTFVDAGGKQYQILSRSFPFIWQPTFLIPFGILKIYFTHFFHLDVITIIFSVNIFSFSYHFYN